MASKVQRVVFSVLRHGKKGGGDVDALTPEGYSQVANSARRNLAGIPFARAFYSGMRRAMETVFHALRALDYTPARSEQPAVEKGGRVVTIFDEPGFGYAWAVDNDRWPLDDDLRKAHPHSVMVEQWLETWPPARAIRQRFRTTLLYQAWVLIKDHPEDEVIHALVGSHSPTADLAALDPEVTPCLAEADGMVYTVEVGPYGPVLRSSEVFWAS